MFDKKGTSFKQRRSERDSNQFIALPDRIMPQLKQPSKSQKDKTEEKRENDSSDLPRSSGQQALFNGMLDKKEQEKLKLGSSVIVEEEESDAFDPLPVKQQKKQKADPT